MKKLNLRYGLIAVMAVGISANVNAQDLTCGDISFNSQGFEAYEFIDQACQEVVLRDGEEYAKLHAQVVAQAKSGTHIRFQHSDGTWGPSHLSLDRNFVTQIDGKDVKVKDLPVRQEVNVYIPAEYFAVNEDPADEVVEEDYVAPPPPPEPVAEEAPVVLPTTAGPLPWLALFGAMFLMLGGALRLSRKQ